MNQIDRLENEEVNIKGEIKNLMNRNADRKKDYERYKSDLLTKQQELSQYQSKDQLNKLLSDKNQLIAKITQETSEIERQRMELSEKIREGRMQRDGHSKKYLYFNFYSFYFFLFFIFFLLFVFFCILNLSIFFKNYLLIIDKYRLKDMENLRTQRLEFVRNFDRNAYNAYKWYTENTHKFEKPVSLIYLKTIIKFIYIKTNL